MVSGERMGPFLVLIDGDGLRHVVKTSAIRAIHDGDPCQDSTIIEVAGGRAFTLPVPLDQGHQLDQAAGLVLTRMRDHEFDARRSAPPS